MSHACFRWLWGQAFGAAPTSRCPTSSAHSPAAVLDQPSQLQCCPEDLGRHRHGMLLFACCVQQHTVRPSAVSRAVSRVRQSDAACADTCACCGHHTDQAFCIMPILQRLGYLLSVLSDLPPPAAAQTLTVSCLSCCTCSQLNAYLLRWLC